jgi:hypothetical protein
MTVIPASVLSRSEMHRLGNNILPAIKRDRRRAQMELVNRSLEACSEAVDELFAVVRSQPVARRRGSRTLAC